MSVDVFVFLKRSNLPSTDEWQETLTKLDTDLVLDAECQAEDHSGYWPASFPDGLAAGFEFLLSPVAEGYHQRSPRWSSGNRAGCRAL